MWELAGNVKAKYLGGREINIACAFGQGHSVTAFIFKHRPHKQFNNESQA